MLPLTEQVIRGSFCNASRKEVSMLTLPPDLETLDWERLDYLGWQDPKLARRAYLMIPDLNGAVTGILLRRADAKPNARAQCSWCRDVTLPNDVVLYVAKRTGPAGRKGDAVGTLICEGFECSTNVRRLPPLAYEGFDRDAARDRRIDDLRMLAAAFAAEL
ncbi:FBP domain-containing protein [Microbacterium hominis]|uniref:FBP domain-containing protein n=1 Tax=Microbacterium hominis TaxID=162426 RepID=A0A7D4UJM4_9MICO|nr:FBP domain-containing protein [Microbacterium hominis]QKJ19727.1 FBP domain-containing protein [Microbacterium hominis]